MKDEIKHSRWSPPYLDNSPPKDSPYIYASARLLSNDFIPIYHAPKFQLPADSSIYAIGSCFAREIETVLHENGNAVLSSQVQLPKEVIPFIRVNNDKAYIPGNGLNKIFTKFNSHSVLHELEIVLGDEFGKRESLVA